MKNKEKIQFNEACAKHLKLNYVENKDDGEIKIQPSRGMRGYTVNFNPFEDAAQLNEVIEFMKIDVVYNCWIEPNAWSAASQNKIACHNKKRNLAIINCIASILRDNDHDVFQECDWMQS